MPVPEPSCGALCQTTTKFPAESIAVEDLFWLPEVVVLTRNSGPSRGVGAAASEPQVNRIPRVPIRTGAGSIRVRVVITTPIVPGTTCREQPVVDRNGR